MIVFAQHRLDSQQAYIGVQDCETGYPNRIEQARSRYTGPILESAPSAIILRDKRSLSRHHALIVRTGGCFEMQDLNSTNGAAVNGAHRPAIEHPRERSVRTLRNTGQQGLYRRLNKF
jgi:pSer/pThr/pTyr-binding forkhead associated (FHA) protein